ncbi:MAG TPA: DUF5698 domain-containing protein [Candidatus Polarisedimenticolia bacterium]|nr:DUF5698 domain-containing protein [Candidatus Polarisedimenticolia bacterium]
MATVFVTSLCIVLARIADVSLDTLRTTAIVQGRRSFSAVLGFFEALIYIGVVAKVLLNIHQPVYAVAYATGFALGTYVGVAVEQFLGYGLQLATIVTSREKAMTAALSAAGYRVAQVKAHVGEGDVSLLYVQVPRRRTPDLLRHAGAVDDTCFCVVNDLRMAGAVRRSLIAVPAR